MKTQIVKVQMPLAVAPVGAPTAGYLVYARGRRHMVAQTITLATSEALGPDKKAYFEAEFTGHVWRIGKRVDDQDW